MPQPRALVVFTDQHDLRWLRWLKPGFRHCFVIARDPAGEWIACDWLLGRFAFRAFGPQEPLDLAARFVARGHRVVVVDECPRSSGPPWLRPMTCVEVVKQVLGWHGLRPVTPWGLYRALRAAGHQALHP